MRVRPLAFTTFDDEYLKNTSIPIPPMEVQSAFEDLVKQSDKSKFELQYVKRNVKEMITCSQKKIRLNR